MKLSTSLSVLIALLFCNVLLAQNQAAYLRTTGGNPWGSTTNETIMNSVFGAGNWSDLRFETVDVTNLLATHGLIFLEGSDNGANELETFLINNIGAFENWVNSGGNLFLNSAPNEGNGMSFGFGGTNLIYGNNNTGTAAPVDISHPIFNGPFLPVVANWSGNSFAHATVTGTNLEVLVTEFNNPSKIVVAQKQWGAGKVIFGGMTTINYHSPQPQAENLRKNILDYLKFNPVPVDAGIVSIDSPMVFCAGMQDVKVTLANLGLDTLFDVVVNWEFDGVAESPIVYNTPLDTFGSGNNTVSLTLGNKNFAAGQIYTIKAWTSDPNGMTDTVNFNDTSSVVVAAGLAGTYTIGGLSPDFNTFSEAVNTLNAFGVCGAVTFNVRNGTYNEQLELNEIIGADMTNNITFQSESDDNTLVILSFFSNISSSNYTLRLNRTDWVTFRGITIEATGTSYGRAVELTAGANHNLFESNIFRSNAVTTTSSNFANFYAIGTFLNEYTRFQNNVFQNGSYGIYFEGNYNNASFTSGTEINQNTFTNQYRWGIYLYYQNAPQIDQNLISTNSAYTAYRGIYLDNVYGSTKVTGNNISGSIGDFGMYLAEVNGTAGAQVLIANNFVQMSGSNTVYGIYSYYGDYQTILYNTINLTNTNAGSAAFYNVYGSNKILLNNIFANTGGGFAFYTNNTPPISNSDYNDLYTTGPVLGYWDGNRTDLADWQTASTLDLNSLSVNPQFVTPDGYAVTEIDLNAAAFNSPLVTVDIDNESRDGSTPDIGADEWSPPTLDASLLGLTNPVSPFEAGNQPIIVVLKNNGVDSLFSADIDWEFDAAGQTTVNWTGALGSSDTALVNIGSQNFSIGQGHDIRAWVSNPNNGVDPVASNDTLTVNDLYAALGGVYTIGGATPDFNTFTEAVNALDLGGVVDSVIFNVRNGTYTEQLNISEILGVDSLNHVVFQSESGDSTQVTLTYSANSTNNYTLRFNGADWITFSKMTLQATNTTYGTVVDLTNESNHICLQNNVINGVAVNTTSSTRTVIYITSSFVNEYFTLKHNRILNGSYGLYYLAPFVNASGTEIVGNYFGNQYYISVYLDEHNHPIVTDNEIQCNSPYTGHIGIYTVDCNLGGEVRRNRVYGNAGNMGMQLYNMIGEADNQLWVTNNFVEIGAGTANTVYGINLSYGNYQQVLYNTVRVTSTNAGSSALYTISGSNRQFFNNIWANTGGGLALFTNSPSSVVASDYNDLYTTGTNVLYWGGVYWPTLADWQNGGNTTEVNSISENPFFLNAFNYQVAQSALNGAATPLADVTIDIEGETRDPLLPDMGADEFALPTLDAGISSILPPAVPFAVGSQPVQVVLRNHGVDTLQSVAINWTVNGVGQSPINWTGQLATSDTQLVALDNVDFLLGQGMDIVAWTSNPNSLTDPVTVNDTSLVNDLYAGLGGTYTIGGVAPDFPNFTSAVSTLNRGGVVGAVVFNARDGVYNEQLNFDPIIGADSLNNVLFQSESGDSSLVTLTFNSNSAANYILRLNGADWVSFKKLTLEATNSTYQRIVEILNGSNHISLENNRIKGVAMTSTSNTRALIYITSSTVNEYLRIKNNRFENGGYGIFFEGNYNNNLYIRGTEVVDNIFENQYTYGVYLYYQNSPLVARNKISTTSGYTAYRGIYTLVTYYGTTIRENIISGQIGGIGMMLNEANGTVSEPCLVANNFIQIGGTGTVQGIYLNYGSYLKVYHNSVHLTNTGTGSHALYSFSGSTKEILNNILANSGGGQVYYNSTSSSISQSNFNDLYTTGATLGYYSGTTYPDLTAWQTGTSRDTNSVSVDPLFLSATDLHVSNVVLDKLGTPVPEVTVDIDGDFRDPAKPDVGADEFSTAPNDAGVVSIDSPVMPFAADVQPIHVTILNNGLDTLQSVNVNWEVNGVLQAPFNWSGVLLSGQTLDSLNLGNFTFEIDTAYAIRAWTSDPNGMPDPENFNDTSTVSNLYAALSGIYTLGGSNPNFSSFQQAATSLSNGGVIGPVVFNVRNGTYDEQLTFPQILGVDATNTVTFQSETGDSTQVILSSAAATNSNNYVVKLDGTDWFRFQKMTIKSTSPSYFRVFYILNGANNNEFLNNEIVAPNVNSTSTLYALVYSDGGDDNNNVFRYNRFLEGSYGLFLYGTNTSILEEGTIIEHNSFEGQYYMGIRMLYQNAPQVSYNTFSSNAVYCCSYYGIYSDYSRNDYRFVNNYFYDLPSGYGMYLSDNDGNVASRGLVANNFIAMGQGNGNTSYGIYSTGSDYQDIYHNSVNVNSSSTSTRAFYLNANNVNVKNNIFASVNKGYAYYKFSGTNVTTDYNDLFGNDTNLAYWNGLNAVDLPAWQAVSLQAANSLNIDPQYISANDLHVDEVDLNNSGTPIAAVAVDFDGEARDPLTPDIGADEFSPITTNDAGVVAILSPNNFTPFPEGVQAVEVAIKNNGADTLLNVTIEWEANGLPQVSYNWSGFLLPGERDTLVVGSHNFNVGFANNLLAYTVNPNSLPDNNTANDTSIVLDLYPALLGTYTIGGSFPNFGNFTNAANSLNKGGILGAVTFNVRNGTYNEQIVLNQINGASAANTIVFQSENGDSSLVRMEHNNASNKNYLVQLNGADYVTFQRMTFRNTGYYSRIFELTNGADNNQILHSRLIDVYNGGYQLIYSAANLDYNNRIQYNRFENGAYGVYMVGQNTSQLESGTRILDNVFVNQSVYGIYLYYQDAPKVERNVIQTNSTRNDFNGIYLRYCYNDFTILQNKINGGYGYGINLNRCDATIGARALIANNFIQVGGTATAYGIYDYYGSFHNVYHNSVHLTNSNASSRAFYNYYGTNKNALNNIFANAGGGYSIYIDGNSGLATSNFNDLYSTGTNLGYWEGNLATNLAFWQAISGKDFSSVSANPLFYSATDLHALQVALDSAATSISGLSTDIDGELRNVGFPDIGADEFDYLQNDLGIVGILEPMADCDLSSAERIKVVVQNYGGLPQSGFDLSFGLTGGSQTTENVGALTVQPGDTAHYTFSATLNMSNYLIYPLQAYTLLAGELNSANDTFEMMVQNYQTPALVSNMLPSNGAINIDPPINFSWLPSLGALRYDLYLWEENDPEPTMPIGQDLTQITFAYSSNAFIFGATYKWKLVAKNNFCETEGPTQTFTLRELPDLVVNSVQAPASPFSGQSIEVTWEIENQAIGSTGMTQWYDYLYLSADNIYQPSVDIYLGGFANLTALDAMQSYSQMKSVTLPQGIQGTYYLFVVTDNTTRLIEGFENNNVSIPVSMLINLTPPPDLIVSSIIAPNNAFSGTPVNITWTVMNQGAGDIVGGTHIDRIYISDEDNYNPANAIFLGQQSTISTLNAGDSYTKMQSVTLPQSIFGDYYIHVVTDFNNRVYEYVFEDNNDRTSGVMNIILTPPPDLVVSNIVVPDSVSNRASVNIQWRVNNQGATPATNTFTDRIYLSKAAVFHPDSVTVLSSTSTNSDILPGEFITRSANVNIPANVSDVHYIYVYTDINNNVFEHTNEDNNISRSDTLIISPADVIVSGSVIPDTIYSGTQVNVEWTVKNQGLGDVLNFNRTDKIYVSTNPVFDVATATNIGNLGYNGILSAGQTVNKQKALTIPNGIAGNYYFHIQADANNNIYEKDQEGNNLGLDSAVVLLSPWPDLRVDALLGLPDTTTAGTLLSLDFIVRNYGQAAVAGTGTWQDRVYLSPNPSWNPADAVSLKTLDILQPVGVNETYTGSTSFVLPMLGGGAGTGICYVYVFADVNNKIYEYTDENNNVKRSNPITVFAPEPVDFAILNATNLPDTVSSGDLVNLQWQIENKGNTTALWNYQLWYDGVFLCEDSTWHWDYEDFVKDFTKQGPLGRMESYSNNQMFNIPNGLDGDYYAFLVADHTNITNDVVDSNSVRLIRPSSFPTGMAKPIHIKLKPSPDLVVNTMVAPTSGFAGQPIQIIWTVENNGLGNTSGTWTDKVYLSTDFNIDNGDKIIGTKNQTRVIAPNGSYTDTMNVFIPITSVGNFVLILKTDANNAVFELNGETNNTFFNFLTTTLPLPSDLVVNSISFNPTALVGQPFMVNYDLYNQGVNPATGFMQDLIYFSADSILDASDVKHIGPISRNINLAPASSLSLSPSALTPGVPLGDYYVIVQTDILNNIFENSETNNVSISTQKVNVSVTELPLAVLTPDILKNNVGLYYRIEIPGNLAGETMLVTLDALSSLGVNELFLSYGSVPTRSVHDFSFSEPFAPDQEIIVPELQAGTYYLLAYGATSEAAAQQSVNLLAEIIPFQIRTVQAPRGGNTGNVTVKVEGAKFTPDMDLEIFDAALGGISAHKITYVNSTKVFATFNLAGAALGFYDVIGTKPGETATLAGGFEVVEGGAGTTTGGGNNGPGGFFCEVVNVGAQDNLSKDIQHPARIRVNRLVPITLIFGNNGNVDIPCPFRWLLSMRGAPLSFDPDDFSEALQELYIEFQEPGGPPGILRPGSSSSITVYSYSSHPLRFILKE